MNKKYIIPIAVVAVIVILWVFLGGSSEKSIQIFATPKTGPFQVSIVTNGSLKAKNSVKIKAPAGMREAHSFRVSVEKLIPEGTMVKKGDFVAQLSTSDISNEVNQDKQELIQRETSYRQAKMDSSQTLLQARNNIKSLEFAIQQAQMAVQQSQYESKATQKKMQFNLQKAKRQYEQAKKGYQIKVNQAKIKLQHLQQRIEDQEREIAGEVKVMNQFTINAPQDGMVIYKTQRDGSKLTQGGQVTAFDRVVALLPDFSIMQSITYVSEVDIQKVHKGEQVDITLDAYPDKHLTGVVTSVANIGEQRPNSSAKVFKVVVQIDQSMPKLLRPSMTTRNVIHTNFVDSALYVPLGAIYPYHDSLHVVFRHKGGGAVIQQVILGLMNNTQTIIKAGVKPSDELYLSMPSDTSDLKFIKLPADTVQKYKKIEQAGEKQNKPRSLKQRSPRMGSSRKFMKNIPDSIKSSKKFKERMKKQFKNTGRNPKGVQRRPVGN